MTAPVPVRLAFFTAERSGSGAVLRWRVDEATDHAGFHVHRKPAGGERTRITTGMLAGRTEYEFVDRDAPRGVVSYYLEELSRTGASEWHGPVILQATSVVTPGLILSPAHPNPFNAATKIEYSLAREGSVRLAVFDIRGRLVQTLVDRVQAPGPHAVSWDGTATDGRRVAFGQYLIHLMVGGEARSQKVLFVR